MKKVVFNTLKYILFFAIGILIFWLLYRKIEWEELVAALKGLKYQWLVLSVVFGLMSHFSRAMRWRMLIKPMGYNPAIGNTFLSILVLYFVNLIVPRAGEVARCTVISRTDKVPFTKLVGTVFTERLADVVMLFALAIIILASNLEIVSEFFNHHPDMQEQINKLLTPKTIIIGIIVLILIISGFFVARNRLKKSTRKGKLVDLKDQLIDGIKSIASMKHKWLFIGHTIFIFLMWLLMLYVVFLAYEPTNHLSMRTGMVVFLMGGLAMLAPVQGGIGPWHFMVYQTLILYGIPAEEGKIFALVAHTTTNLIYIVLGGLSLLFLVLKYGNKAVKLQPEEENEAVA